MWNNNEMNPKHGTKNRGDAMKGTEIKSTIVDCTSQINLIKMQQMQFLLKRGNILYIFVEEKKK